MSEAVLHNLRILDFTWVLAGPFATRMLADFGAEIIKVQPLLPEANDTFSRGYYNTWNRNKLGITLNMGQPAGIEIARKLIKISDAVVENFSPRVMANWGLDYSEMVKIKPDIILLSMSALGHTGPWRDYTGFGPTVQAFSGITYLTAYPGQPPLGLGYSYADHIAGLYASLSLLGALEYRHQTGRGQFIDLSQTETMASLMSDAILKYTLEEQNPQPSGNASLRSAPHGIYPCLGRDRWCAISVDTAVQWEGFKRALGNPSWTLENRFATPASRLENSAALDEMVKEWASGLSAEDVMRILQREGVPAGIVQNASDLSSDPQLRDRGFFIGLEHPELGQTLSDASPIKLSDNPAEYYRSAPLKGQDNDYVYKQLLGLTDAEISQLQQDGTI